MKPSVDEDAAPKDGSIPSSSESYINHDKYIYLLVNAKYHFATYFLLSFLEMFHQYFPSPRKCSQILDLKWALLHSLLCQILLLIKRVLLI